MVLPLKISGRWLAFVIIIMTIVSSSQTLSILQEISATRHQKFVMNHEEDSTFNNKWTVKTHALCGPMLAKILDQITELYMPEKKLFCLFTKHGIENDCLADGLKNFLKLGSRNVITIMPGSHNFDLRQVVYQKPNVYVLFDVDPSAVPNLLINFGRMSSTWNPRGLYISIVKSEEEAAEVMTILWKKFIYKVVVLVIRNNSLDAVEAYTWRPYYPGNYCGPPTVENIVRLGKFTETLKFRKEVDIEPGVIPKTFGNCPFNVKFNLWAPYVFLQEEDQKLGVEGNLIKTVCDKLGLKLNAEYHALTSKKEKGAVAWAGARIPRHSDLAIFDVSVTYVEDALVWLVPRRNKIRVSGLDVRGSFLDSEIPITFRAPVFLVMTVVMVSLALAGSRHWFFLVWGIMWEQAHDKMPKKTRGIWCCWLFLCLHLGVAYKTALVSHLTNPLMESEIQNQSELLESGLKLAFLSEAESFFDKDDEVEKKILQRYVPCETVRKCYGEILTGKAVFTNKLFADYLKGERNATNEMVDNVHQLPSSLTYKVAMLYAKGHAVVPSFDKIIRSALEAGFMAHWIEIERTQLKITMHRLNLSKEQKLSFFHILRWIRLLFAGYTVAGVLFLCEKSCYLLQARILTSIKGKSSFWKQKIKI